MSVIGNPLLLSPEGYQIERSVRLRSSASAYFNRTPASAGNRKTWTWSGWVKRGQLGTIKYIASAYYATSNGRYNIIRFDSADKLNVWTNIYNTSSSATQQNTTTAVFRDTSAWYHVVIAFDSTNATASSRLAIYVNGISQTYSGDSITLNQDTFWNGSDSTHKIGDFNSADYFDGYLTDVNFIDGQALTPSSFGETDAVTGVWKPKKYAGTYGTNGFYLNFSDNSAATAATIGKDYSGNGNNWTPNNISVTAGATYDSMLDVPTMYADGGNGRGNYAVLSPIDTVGTAGSVAAGNLNLTGGSAAWYESRSGFGITSGKWYWEITIVSTNTTSNGCNLGIASSGAQGVGYAGANKWTYNNNSGGRKALNTVSSAYGVAYVTNDVVGVAFDADAGTLVFYVNNSSQGTAASSGLPNPAFPCVECYGSDTVAANFGQRPFAYTPPTGFKALQTGNLPEPTIVDGSQFFAVDTYTGTGVAQTRTIGFEPGLVWNKIRSQSYDHNLQDVLRGTGVRLISNSTDQDLSITNCVTAFNSDGYSVGSYVSINGSGESIVNWAWKANGAGVSNTDGSITSTVSAGVTQGFSVVTWAGTSTNASTIGHGLGVAPKMIITKSRSNPTSWVVGIGGISGFGVNDYFTMNTTSAKGSTSTFYQAYGSSTFTVGVSAADEMNKTGNNYVSYCFAEVPGFSKFGSYTGNGSADGTFVFTGFRPAFVMIKQTNGTGQWVIQDTSRNTYNDLDLYLLANSSGSEATLANIADYVSNGFKLRANASSTNASGGTYIYMAFAEHPFKNALAR